jgi:N-acetylornithine carbamoyltransferase
LKQHAASAGGSVEFTTDVNAAFDDVDVVYAKSWGGSGFYGDGSGDIAHRAQFRSDWIVDEKKMSATNDGIFMHCLPVRRNVIVTDGVIDSANSVVIDEAENRLHVQKAIMSEIIK